jgi:hypothetical protein
MPHIEQQSSPPTQERGGTNMINYDVEGRRRIAMERIERLSHDYRRASRRSVRSVQPQRVGPGPSPHARRSLSWARFQA